MVKYSAQYLHASSPDKLDGTFLKSTEFISHNRLMKDGYLPSVKKGGGVHLREDIFYFLLQYLSTLKMQLVAAVVVTAVVVTAVAGRSSRWSQQ